VLPLASTDFQLGIAVANEVSVADKGWDDASGEEEAINGLVDF
jgi:hypothetical protein